AGYADIRNKALVRFCPVCDGFEFTNERIGVLGSGHHGARECAFIKHFSNQVTYLSVDDSIATGVVTDDLRALNIAVLDARQARLEYNETTHAIALTLGDSTTHAFDVLYCALGCRVRSTLATALGARHDEQQGLLVDNHLETTVKGLFAAGDVVSSLHQLAVATGQAATAATAIHNRLRDTKR
ncbi:MAG: FAD-dependent oxidoreductase, partial [Pseudomonadota bacterium]